MKQQYLLHFYGGPLNGERKWCPSLVQEFKSPVQVRSHWNFADSGTHSYQVTAVYERNRGNTDQPDQSYRFVGVDVSATPPFKSPTLADYDMVDLVAEVLRRVNDE